MKTILLDNSYSEKWDEFIKSSPKGNFGHLSGWSKVYELYGYKSYLIAAIDDADNIKGVLPLFLTRNILGKKYLISNPLLGYAGICAEDNKTGEALIQKAKEVAIRTDVEYVEIRQLADMIGDLPSKKDFVTLFLRLENNENIIWKNVMEPTVRNKIRKALKSGLTVDFGNQYFDDFYKVLSVNYRDLGTPLHGKPFFKQVLNEFNKLSGIIVTKYEDKIIAGMLYIHFKNIFSVPWASSLREYNKLRPNNILYWEAIKYACKNGFEYFDFGRSTIGQGTLMFKKQWGATQVQMYYQYSLNRANSIPKTNAVQKSKYQLAINIWKRLPLIITNKIGPIVVKYLPEF